MTGRFQSGLAVWSSMKPYGQSEGNGLIFIQQPDKDEGGAMRTE
jgi:hypothetical protein